MFSPSFIICFVGLGARAIRRRVKKIEDTIFSRTKDDLILVWSFGPPDEPHGKYGYRKFHNNTGELEACTEEEELEFLRVAYLKIPPKISKRVPGLSDFEEYKERHKCKCNLHDESNSVKFSGEFFTKCVRAAVHNIIDEMRRDIYTLIRTGEIQETEDVRKVLSLFEWED